MKSVGIICEYNPFHNGHLYHIKKVKELYPDYVVIAVINGDFTQRGDVSLIDKWQKTEVALNYVDLVVELPFVFGTQAADIFTKGGADILNALKVDAFVFGSESSDINKLRKIVEIQESMEYSDKIKQYLDEGLSYPTSLAKALKDLGIILLEDELRKGIKDTLNYFSDLNINIKIISGDNALTVKEVAKMAGVLNYEKYISMKNVTLEEIKDIVDEYTIFGRTTPDQKQEIIRCLQEKGHKVGYIGDGVNDTTSLRQADCSIAMNNGADSAKAVSDVILLDNDFSHLPLVFKEGRRVVSNIMRSVLLFLTKSFFIGIFSFLSVFMSTGLPIEIESIYIYEFISIALCGFLLSIQQTSPEPIKGDFVANVISKSVVFGALLTLSGLIPVIVNALVPGGIEHWASLIVVNVTISGLCVLLYICYPFKKYTVMVSCIGIILSILASLALPDVFFNPGYLKQANNLGEQFKLIFDDLFNLTLFKSFQYYEWIMVVIYLVIAPLLLIALMKLRSLIIKNKERIKSKFLKAIKGKVKE